MFPVEIPGECCVLFAEWREARDQTRDASHVLDELGKAFGQEPFFVTNDGEIDREKENDDDDSNPPVPGGDCEAYRNQNRSQIKRVASVGVGAAGGESLVLAHMARGRGAQSETGKNDAYT